MKSHVKGVTQGYPLLIRATEVKTSEIDFNSEFITSMVSRIDYTALKKAVEMLEMPNLLPAEVCDDYANNEKFLKKLHHVIMEIDVIDGELECPQSGRKFPISRGIPNMLLNEDEVVEVCDDYANNEEFLKKLHHVIMEIDVIDGELEC